MVLNRELKTYADRFQDLLAHEGKFVLIHEGDIAGFFDTYADAVQAGYERYDLQPFLVKQVQAVEQAQFISAGPCQS